MTELVLHEAAKSNTHPEKMLKRVVACLTDSMSDGGTQDDNLAGMIDIIESKESDAAPQQEKSFEEKLGGQPNVPFLPNF